MLYIPSKSAKQFSGKKKSALPQVPTLDEYIGLKLRLEEEAKRTRTMGRKMRLRRLIQRNQVVRDTDDRNDDEEEEEEEEEEVEEEEEEVVETEIS